MRLVPRSADAANRHLTYIAHVTVAPIRGTFRYRQMVAARERLFEGLDGHTINRRGRTWQVRVYSICEEPGAWWLQVALEGDPEYTITFRTPLLETAPETLSRLALWLETSEAEATLTIP
jgi:hypothetical protein